MVIQGVAIVLVLMLGGGLTGCGGGDTEPTGGDG